MSRSGFRPRLGPTLFTGPVVLLCVALGLWQLQRLHWKEDLIAQCEAALAAPPVAPPHTLADARALEYHRVIDEGVFLHDKEILVNAIGPEGGTGFNVLTPLREPGGGIVFVNRGFVPTGLKDPAKRRAGEPAGMVRVAGLLRLPPDEKPGWFIPHNQPGRNSWFWIDLGAISAADGLIGVAPFYIEADATPNPGGWPKGRASLPALPNNHLQYAITWFSLAVSALVIYFLAQRRVARGDVTNNDRISET
jgi:surfeit locus 1 family protein